MDVESVAAVVDGIPHMPLEHGRAIHAHVVDHGLARVLELGTSHGVSACYLGAAVDEIGTGHVTTLDFTRVAHLEPSVFDLLDRTGLEHIVTPILSEFSYTWVLKSFIEKGAEFDFVFIDAGHSWDITGFGFLLVDRLLVEGGWLLFDDLNWSFATSPSLRDTEMVRKMHPELREARQVAAVFEVLVNGDRRYETRRDGNWGWAQKTALSS